ncbi:hypothetical protein RN51_03327 [Microbacterium oxydans]|uniref:Helix-turn-helix domain-containing protein n=1 Tax=Microbacterium oxydans TaxID=82380 RepID=A0A0F0KC84_9MICO|nr:helix-turn-helix domain-containing protein [Microbacterium oxydans]KJL18493.1 hypothetical protein RN51_03327 [Microbacterium oxydans]
MTNARGVKSDGWVRLPNWLIDDADLTLHEMAVYVVLLRFRDHKTGRCFPGMTTIADCARVSRDTVKRTIPLLEAKGLIRVTKRREGTRNLPNIYDVALAAETPEFIWATSRRGQRIPKRRRSEHLPNNADDESGCSELDGGCSEHTNLGAPSTSNKTYLNKTHEQTVTPAFVESASEAFSFDSPEEDTATEGQVAYLKDLAIHLGYASGGGIPNDVQLERWRKLTRVDATKQIRGYLKALGRPDDIYYPQLGDPEYAALSDAGKEFAESAGDPSSVWDYMQPRQEENA